MPYLSMSDEWEIWRNQVITSAPSKEFKQHISCKQMPLDLAKESSKANQLRLNS
jgi:predicted NAD-dependent protein-ADP-ribosyltransferase YbiA (DUF1768 family)